MAGGDIAGGAGRKIERRAPSSTKGNSSAIGETGNSFQLHSVDYDVRRLRTPLSPTSYNDPFLFLSTGSPSPQVKDWIVRTQVDTAITPRSGTSSAKRIVKNVSQTERSERVTTMHSVEAFALQAADDAATAAAAARGQKPWDQRNFPVQGWDGLDRSPRISIANSSSRVRIDEARSRM